MYKRKRAGNTITRKINSTKDTAAKADKNHYISNSYLEGFIPIDTEYFTASVTQMTTYINHDYIHSFRFAQAQNVMKIFSLSLFFFIILLVGNSVYYKSRGGEWAVRHAG